MTTRCRRDNVARAKHNVAERSGYVSTKVFSVLTRPLLTWPSEAVTDRPKFFPCNNASVINLAERSGYGSTESFFRVTTRPCGFPFFPCNNASVISVTMRLGFFRYF